VVSEKLPVNARQVRGCIGGAIVLLLLVAFSLSAAASSSVRFGNTTITLNSQKYYKHGDYTRLVYQVKSSPHSPPEAWILGVGSCLTEEAVIRGGSTEYEWVEAPIRGLQFRPASKDEKVYIYLEGHWLVGPLDVTALGAPGLPGGEWAYGTIDGPTCGASSIAIEIVEGDTVAFPPIVGAGVYSPESGTLLRISSSSSGWVLTDGLEFTLPPGASVAAVERVFEVLYDEYDAGSGTTDVGVEYRLNVAPQDFEGLPEGTYVIRITYTIAVD
jgi:hypothetical protein